MNCSAIIFDLDGTLLDTLADIAQACNRVLQTLGYPTHPEGDFRCFVGAGVYTLFARALPAEAVSDAAMARCVESFREIYGRHWNVHTRPYEGIQELLDALAARGLKLAVLSNKPDAFTKLCVQHYLADWPLDPVLGQRDGVPRKPDPAGAREILDHLAIPAEACLYLGDSDIDMQTARAAGVYPVGALWGFRTAEELSASGAAVLIRHPLDLLEVLRSTADRATGRSVY